MRILVADDEPRLIAAYKVCLERDGLADAALDALGAELFGEAAPSAVAVEDWRVDYVQQGEAAVAAVARARAAGDPYAVLFLDMRMPPGIDGRETARQVRILDPDLNIVVVTGFSDHSPQDIAKVAGPLDKLYYLAKPFETAEIRQLAQALAAKWTLEEDLKRANRELQQAYVELRASEAHSRHIALHDLLTKLPNRLAFQERLGESFHRHAGSVGAMFIDIDHFKRVNDTLGHQVGDLLICEIGQRLQGLMPPGALLARLGGDEFGVAIQDARTEGLLALGEQIVAVCGERFEILGNQVFVGASVGVSVCQAGDGVDSSELLRRADLALYAAKKSGRSAASAFEQTMDDHARMRIEIDARLREAIDEQRLTLAYQPIVTPHDGSAIGYEALLRWTDPVLGSVSPATFVPVAEETGLVIKLGEWVLRNAIAECATWESGLVSINLSTRHFQSRLLPDFVCREAAAHGLPLGRIQLEITETALFDDPQGAAATIQELRQRGIRVALDDFGTGYSSLVNLRDFELDCIKIDKSFIATLGVDRQASAIVNSITSLARSLGLNVVAEGVETAGQIQSLRMLGCEMMQGFFYSRPVDAAELPFAVQDGAAEPAASDAPALDLVTAPAAGRSAA